MLVLLIWIHKPGVHKILSLRHFIKVKFNWNLCKWIYQEYTGKQWSCFWYAITQKPVPEGTGLCMEYGPLCKSCFHNRSRSGWQILPETIRPWYENGRTKLFNYIVSELHAIEGTLGEPRSNYPQADKAACWMLLARIYLNAQVYTGTAKWDSCKIYCDKVISSGKYSLASNYRQNFSADNGASNPEMIFAFAYDGVNTQGYTGPTFIIESRLRCNLSQGRRCCRFNNKYQLEWEQEQKNNFVCAFGRYYSGLWYKPGSDYLRICFQLSERSEK